jgi:hypothetical protein
MASFDAKAYLEQRRLSRLSNSGLSGLPAVPEENASDPSLRYRLGQAAMGGARGLASALEPLQLPQDSFFAVLGGALDPNETIWGNLKRVEWSAYAPLGRAPERVTNGSELLGLMGVKDERAQKWGGVLMDLTVDPLIFGAAARAAGKVGQIDELVRFGENLDKAVSVGGQYRLLYDNNRAFRTRMDRMTEDVFRRLSNPDKRIFGIPSSAITGLADQVLPTRTAARLKLGETGEDVMRNIGMGKQLGKDVYEEVLTDLRELERGVFGEDAKPFMRRAFEILKGYPDNERKLRSMPTALRTLMRKEAYDLVDRRGMALADDIDALPQLDDAVAALRKARQSNEDVDDLFALSRQDYQETVERVRRSAEKRGMDGDLIAGKFQEYVKGVTTVDAKLGFHLSGYDTVRQKVMRRIMQVTGSSEQAAKVWDRVLAAGLTGGYDKLMRKDSGVKLDDVFELTAAGRAKRNKLESDFQTEFNQAMESGEGVVAARDRARMTREGREVIDEDTLSSLEQVEVRRGDMAERGTRGADKNLTFRELLGDEFDKGSALPLDAYLQGLKNGHLRRAFGVFADGENFQRYIRNMQEGKIIANNILDENSIHDILGEGFRREADLIEDYRKSLTGKNKDGKQRGVLLTKHNLFEHIAENLHLSGMSKREAGRRANEALLELHKGIQPSLGGVIKNLKNAAARYTAKANEGRGAFGRGAFSSREKLESEVLDVLGEFADPLFSLQESATAARVRLPMMDFMRRTYDTATESGAAKRHEFVDEHGVRFVEVAEGEGIMGPFAGKYIHPHLYQEIHRVQQNRGNTSQGLARLRSLVMGGYLAAPNVITANLAGGIFTSIQAGIAPHRFIRALIDTAPPVFRGDKNDPTIATLRNLEPVDMQGVVSADLANRFERLKQSEVALGPEGVRKFMGQVADAWEHQLNAPLGQRMLGLSGFQTVERWMKTAAFKAHMEALEQSGRRMSRSMMEREAAEMARISVFDYDELPRAMQVARDWGILMFPGFTTFLMGRTLNAALNRPGGLAMADRLSEAVANSYLDEDEKYAVYAGMAPWLRQEQGVPIAVRRDEAGDKRVSVIPLNQLIPTAAFFEDWTNPLNNPWAESLATGGIYRPAVEILTALVNGDGEAPFSKRYGAEVFTPESRGAERLGDVLSFAYNNFAPSAARKAWSPQAGGDKRGLLPAAQDVLWPDDLANTIYSFSEIKRKRADREFKDEVIASLLRSPQVIATGGALAGIRTEHERAKQEMNDELSGLRRRMQQAYAVGNSERGELFKQRIIKTRTQFVEKWKPIMQGYQELNL